MADKEKKNLPEEEVGADEGIYTLVDEDGKEYDFQIVADAELDGNHYFAMVPVEPQKDEEDQYVVMKLEKDENGEDMLTTVEDDEEFDKVADYFDDQLNFEEDYDQ